VYATLVTQTLGALATMTVLPAIPFVAMGLGANAFTIAMFGSAYNLAQMLCSPACGALSDRIGRKAVMVSGLVGQAACNVLMSYAASVPQLLAVRVAMGLAMSTGPAEMAYIMDSTSSEHDLSHVLCVQRIVTSCGAVLGPLVAKAFEQYPFSALCRGLFLINMVNLVIGILLWEEIPQKEVSPPSTPSGASGGSATTAGSASWSWTMRRLLSNTTTSSLMLVSWIYSLGYSISDGPEMVFFKEYFGFDRSSACYFLVVTNSSSLVFSMVAPALVNHCGAQCTCKVGCFGVAASVLGLVTASGCQVAPYVYGGLVVGLFGSMLGLGHMHLVRRKCSQGTMGTLLGLQSSLNGFAGTVGPPTGGALYGVNSCMPYLVTALFAACAAGLYDALPEGRTLRDLEQDSLLAEPATAVARAALGPPAHLPEKPRLKRASSFGQPLFPDKSFASQLHLQVLRIEHDPELLELYRAYRDMISKERGVAAGMKTVATIPGDMVAARAQSAFHHGAALEAAEFRRSDTFTDMERFR